MAKSWHTLPFSWTDKEGQGVLINRVTLKEQQKSTARVGLVVITKKLPNASQIWCFCTILSIKTEKSNESEEDGLDNWRWKWTFYIHKAMCVTKTTQHIKREVYSRFLQSGLKTSCTLRVCIEVRRKAFLNPSLTSPSNAEHQVQWRTAGFLWFKAVKCPLEWRMMPLGLAVQRMSVGLGVPGRMALSCLHSFNFKVECIGD